MGEDNVDILAEKPKKNDFLLVGIGASAGGLEALQDFFKHTPADSNLAYVVILHLSPDYDSKLAEILQRETTMPVIQVSEKVRVQPNHIYVIPPNQHLIMLDGEVAVSPNLQIEDRRAPVDIFFRTLAESYHSRAVGVILSGTGANGSMGIKRIKERGGAAFVQNPREAAFSEMPRNSIATDMIDDILSVTDIPAKIIAYKESLGTVQIAVDNVGRAEDQQQALRDIFNQLRLRTSHDFSNYKRPTLLRRIERRINVHNLPSLTAYAAFLNQSPDEPQALLKDLLISVTNFFRDSQAFESIEKDILPRILEKKDVGHTIRIWVIGCATGEEAYSLAMLFTQYTAGILDAPKIQIFATDIDENALTIAREGVYTLNDAADVSPERLRRFFFKQGDEYRVRREIREMILFASHNVLKDPPFSHLDLVTCRNMMIYLNRSAQERVLETIHFALEPGGYLFLGNSESVDGAGDLYAFINREQHIYQSRAVSTRRLPIPEKIPSYQSDKYERVIVQETTDKENNRISYGDLHQQLLEQYAPPSIVVNEEYEIVHITERAGRYLQVSGGEPSKNILKLIRPELRLELRSAFYSAIQRKSNVEARGLKVRVEDRTETINIHVRPVLRQEDTLRGFMLVLFEQSTNNSNSEQKIYTSSESVAQHLEEELIQLKSQLRNTNEQHDIQAEELKASNEELQAINEELRSSTEELETSKEELQSINEELSTVNQELKNKVEELSISNSNFQNLINSTYIATIFLDRSFRINTFTPAAQRIFNLISADFGRPLSDITNKLQYENLQQDAESVLDNLKIVEREVRTADGVIYLMRAQPYRTEEDRINGVVISFVDITELKLSEEALRKSDERFRAFVTASNDAVYRLNADWSEMYNLRGTNFLADTDDPSRTWLQRYIPEKERLRVHAAISEAIRTKSVFDLEHQIYRVDGSIGWAASRAVPLLNEAGIITEWFGAATDVTARKKTEESLRESEERYSAIVNQATASVSVIDAEGKILFVNNTFCTTLDYTHEELLGKKAIDVTYPDDKAQCEELLRLAIGTGNSYSSEKRLLRKGGEVIWITESVTGIRTNAGKIMNAVTIGIDITFRKNAEETIRESEERFRAIVSQTSVGITRTDVLGTIVFMNDRACELFGITADEAIGKTVWELMSAESLEKGQELYRQLIAEKNAIQFDREMKRKDASSFWATVSIAPIKDAEGKTASFVAVLTDITARKNAEIKLHDSEERYRIALESGELATWDWNMKTNSIRWNEQHFHLFGMTDADLELEPEDFLTHVYKEDLNYVKKQLFDAAERTGVYVAEFRIVRDDNNQIRWMTGYGRVTEREDGKATRMTGVMFDSTERKNAEVELLSAKNSLSTALEAANMGVWNMDLLTGAVERSPRHDQLLGHHSWQEEWSKEKANQNILEEDKKKFDEAYSNLYDNGIFQLEARVKHLDGTICWIHYYGRAFRGEDGKKERAAGVIFDITDQKTIEKQKDEFIGVASHELKTPVTSIKAYAEILHEMFTDANDLESANLMSKLDNQVDRLTSLIRDLLDVTKVAEGQLQLRTEAFSIEDMVKDKIEEMQRTTRQHKIKLHFVNLLPDVIGDKERIGQVLINLFSNAIKYSPDKEVIQVTALHENGKINISVQDFGIGMSDITKARLFERFFRSDNPIARSYPGLGLGMFISMEIMKRHGGTILVESEKGKGSIFTMVLPLA